MRSLFYRALYLSIFSLLSFAASFAQIIDLSSEKPYKKVFVDTDNFGSSYLDTLHKTYPKVKSDVLRFSILNDLAYYWHTRNLLTAMKFTKEGLKLTSTKQDTLWNGRFQITQAAILLRMEKLDSAEIILKRALRKVSRDDFAFLNTQLGYVYERRGQLDLAADHAEASLELGIELSDKKAVAIAYSDLSNLFWKQSKLEAGLEYGLKSLEVFEEIGITDLDYDFTLYVVGNNYLSLKEYRKAQQYFEHALVIGERYGFYNNLSDIYISLTDLYAFLNEFEKAEKAGENAVKYAEMLENNFMLMRSWLSIGKLRQLQGKFGMAIESLNKSIAIATEDFGDAYYLSQAYETLGKAHAGNHNYQEAYKAFAEYDQLKRRIFTAEADQRTSLLRTELDVAGKESTILLQESLIKRQKSLQTLFIIIVVLMLLLLVLSYKAFSNNLKKNRLLQKQNEEKEFLLKEIHHRVKNNLERISSLLSLQSAHIQDADVLEAMVESQHRVHSMGMIHQKLYLGKSLASIEMKDYFENLSEYITDVFGMADQVDVNVAMPAFELDVDIAIPIGLIVNELLTNSFKYAFPNGRQGNIRISLKKSNEILQLDVIDDGVGFMLKNDVLGTGFGTKLIRILTKQLDGKIVVNTNQGTSVSIQFQLDTAA
ncbi:MAG: tetratricopeptide repeat protein [Pricia sp.]|nr:tetratricopeptide repeat protein [Pricia sp.]